MADLTFPQTKKNYYLTFWYVAHLKLGKYLLNLLCTYVIYCFLFFIFIFPKIVFKHEYLRSRASKCLSLSSFPNGYSNLSSIKILVLISWILHPWFFFLTFICFLFQRCIAKYCHCSLLQNSGYPWVGISNGWSDLKKCSKRLLPAILCLFISRKPCFLDCRIHWSMEN